MNLEESNKLIDLCGGRSGFLSLFDYLPMCRVYAKDYRGLWEEGGRKIGRFFYGNQRFCETRGVATQAELCGTTDYDYTVSALAAQYVAEDHKIFEEGVPAVGRAWLVAEADGRARVWRSSKAPIFDAKGQPLALLGAMYAVQSDPGEVLGADHFTASLVHVQNHLGEKLVLSDLAGMTGYSVSRYVSKFREHFGETPMNYIKRMRVTAAASELLQTTKQMSEIAYQFGFYDSSHLTRHFKEIMGVTPTDYRKTGGAGERRKPRTKTQTGNVCPGGDRLPHDRRRKGD